MTDTDTDERDQANVWPRFLATIKRYRKLFFFMGLGWFALVLGSGIFLSTLDARSGLHVFGSEVWQSGTTSVLRVSLRELRLNKSKPMRSVTGVFVDNQGKAIQPFELKESAGPYLQGNVLAPSRPGRYRIELTALDGDIPMTAQFAVSVHPHADLSWKHALIPAPLSQKSDKGPTQFTLQPLDGVLANGLPDALAVTAKLAKGNEQTAVDFQMDVGTSSVALPKKLKLSSNEVVIVPIRPAHPFFRFTLKDNESEASRQIKPVATQFIARIDSPIVRSDSVTVGLKSLYRDGVVFVDLWLGNQWFSTTTARLSNYEAQVRLSVPTGHTEPQIAWVRAYRNAYLPGTARGGRHVVISNGQKSDIINWLGRLLLSLPGGDKEFLKTTLKSQHPPHLRAQMLLGRLAWPEHAPPLLADSGETNRQTVAALKNDWQRRFVVALGTTGVLVLLVMGTIMGLHHRDLKRRWIDAGGDIDGQSGTRERIGWEIGYIFLILALFIIGMIQLLLWIRW